jgi:hypothetical protein
MVDRLPVGPYRTLTGPAGSIPWYVVPFDKAGTCTGPRTREHLLAEVGDGRFTDIALFSHGWNNDWRQATGRYDNFIEGYLRQRTAFPPASPARRPVLVGVFWPSKVLVDPNRSAPEIAGEAGEAAIADERTDVAELAERVSGENAARFYDLAQRDRLTADEARELAELLLPLFATDAAEVGERQPPTAGELITAWASIATATPPVPDLDDLGFTRPVAGSGPQAAAFGGLDPREIIRAASVWQMKDRAGVVGARGVAAILLDLLRADPHARVHLLGHSYGAKVVLSALCAPDAVPRPVRSALLLQPAVSHLCFAATVPGTPGPGGYREALARVELPILTTYSSRDEPLTRFFHLALRRRDRDLGEPEIASEGEPPNRYAALGGFGPRGLPGESRVVEVRDPGQPYELDGDVPQVYGVDASRAISGHGDVSNPSTWWMFSQLLDAGGDDG